ncbi:MULTISPECIES: helix-turn-helix transcriptional regulator [Barrientosiimonas]|uniref:HTH luxR-type domain-containing protein n=1 Tax=Barrientosiimonas endolithica TaxID=1535208 RepID=A0ABN6YVJ4_9MICO|nr:LuxR C-terminal-related transcriptional regulator [Barrientosiimonas endolithica]BDZ59566.1 hypothetical protein GCM10025872_32230 [Barrientosiimonas endolithica]
MSATGQDRERAAMQAIGRGGLESLLDLLNQDVMTTVYVQMVQNPRFRPEQLDTHGASPEEVELCLRIFESRGLLHRVDDGSWVTNAPENALADHASRLEERARTLRAATPGLSRIYYDAMARSPRSLEAVGVELLESLEDVNAAMSELFAATRRQVVSMRTRSPRVLMIMNRTPERIAEPVFNSHGETLRLRVSFDSGLLEEPAMPAAVAARTQAGDEIRFANAIPFTATTSDNGVTVMDIDDPSGTSVGMRITHPGVSAAIKRVIDDTWVRGVRWTGRGTVTRADAEPLDDRDRDILALMLGGVADATIARQLGVSQRTVERRVRRLLELLGATTRFQAGAQAVKRGWI